ncbi:hypothetical protein LCGC14_1188760 [marine sediment metagenome]|uniref:Transglycosylase SLT domain-containing protein n=1 Tax=marine sediment metagenome TaxID=412755 RepID=A0A0F9P2T8_9ZZZZ
MVVKIARDCQEREREIREFIEEHSNTFDIDPNLVRALITQESRFKAEAVSPTGAYGLGQFTGIGARQVQNIAAMSDCPDSLELDTFVKQDASQPDVGIKAICATLWWLFNKKYDRVEDKKVQLEAVLTFYNSGGRPAALVVKYGGHDKALPFIKKMPSRYKSQSERYAPEVALWYIAWHELLKPQTTPIQTELSRDPFIREDHTSLDVRYQALIESLRLLGVEDDNVDVMISIREGATEVTLIVPGEFLSHVRN